MECILYLYACSTFLCSTSEIGAEMQSNLTRCHMCAIAKYSIERSRTQSIEKYGWTRRSRRRKEKWRKRIKTISECNFVGFFLEFMMHARRTGNRNLSIHLNKQTIWAMLAGRCMCLCLVPVSTAASVSYLFHATTRRLASFTHHLQHSWLTLSMCGGVTSFSIVFLLSFRSRFISIARFRLLFLCSIYSLDWRFACAVCTTKHTRLSSSNNTKLCLAHAALLNSTFRRTNTQSHRFRRDLNWTAMRRLGIAVNQLYFEQNFDSNASDSNLIHLLL